MVHERENPGNLQSHRQTANLITWLRQHDTLLFSGLVFSFFFLAPLLFVSGFTSHGVIMFTLYDLPKYVFLCPATLFILFLFIFSLSYHQERWKQTKSFVCNNNALRLLVIFFIFQVMSLRSALVPQNALLQLAIYFIFIQLFIVLAILFQQQEILHASLYGTVLSLLIFCPLGILQFFKVQLPFLIPISGPASTLGYRNPAAHYLALNLPFAVYLAYFFWREKNKKSHPGRWLITVSFFSCLALMAMFHIFMATSRTAILALLFYAFLVPLYYLFNHRQSLSLKLCFKSLAVIAAIAILTISSLMVFPGSRTRVMKSIKKIGSLSILEARRYHWGNTLQMIKAHPLQGVGLGNWQFTYPLFMHSYARDTCFTFRVQVRKAHNDYLQIAAECGLGALFIFLLLWGRQFYLVWKMGHQSENEGFNYALFCSLMAFSVIMMFSFPLQMGYSRMFFFYLLALGESSVPLGRGKLLICK